MQSYVLLLNVVQFVLYAYGYLLIATAVLSWVPDLVQTPLGQLLFTISDPYLALFRRFLRPVRIGTAMLDLSFAIGVVVYFAALTYGLSVLSSLLRG